MPADQPPRLLPSFLDRLLDPESMGSPSAPGYNEREMLDAVRADLEDLLNTRLTVTDVPPEFAEVGDSIITYGLPDLVKYNGASPEDCASLAKIVAGVVAAHEPRLKNVRVKVVRGGAGDHESRAVRFHIDAALNVDPAPEVGFETVVELTTGRTTVKPEGAM